MADNRFIKQNKNSISIPRDNLRKKIICNDNLDDKDKLVAFLLLTTLEGYGHPDSYYSASYTGPKDMDQRDPMVFTVIDPSQIADTLGFKAKRVKKCINHLLENDIIEKGSNATVVDGYRFTF